ncbi:MAG: amidohydrolase [Anaerolineales bacterium]
MIDFLSEAQDLFEYTQALRRDFHRHPELGFHEVRTAGIVARELNQLGLEVSSGIAETGVVAMIEGNRPGPVALLRFDMDALPIEEQTGASYASQNPGVMHACGHDGHTAVGLTVARLLHSHRHEFPGAIKLVFQPAEEGVGGAERMLAEGILENPHADAALALHLWNEKPFGWLGITNGPIMAAAEIFHIRVTGSGGHGAVPNLTIDPVLASTQIINALQGIVARNVSPLETAVVSVTSMHAGEAFNVIPAQASLEGTIRTFSPEVRQRVLTRFQQVVEGVGTAMECQVDCQVQSISPAVVNDNDLAEKVRATAQRLLPDSQIGSDYRTMGAEDMAFILQELPGCFFFIGAANPAEGLDAPHHHPRFDFDERALVQAAALMAGAALDYLQT